MPGAGHPAKDLSDVPEGGRGLPAFERHDVGQALRDLRWLLLSPPLLAQGRFAAEVQWFRHEERHAIEDWLKALQRDPRPLQQALEHTGAAPLRLGRHAERLLEFFLRAGPTHHLVAANLPLRGPSHGKGPTTVGEIDFLLEDAAGRAWHWELAVKFFLCVAPGSQARAEDFIGPDPSDTLAGKLQALFERQLRRTPPKPWHERAWQPAAYTRGWMFHRLGQPPAVCHALSGEHLRGQWLPFAEIGRLSLARYLVPPRALWMSPVQAGESDALMLQDELPREIRKLWGQAIPRPLTPRLVAQMEPAREGVWQEVQRYFVVPDGWPACHHS